MREKVYISYSRVYCYSLLKQFKDDGFLRISFSQAKWMLLICMIYKSNF